MPGRLLSQLRDSPQDAASELCAQGLEGAAAQQKSSLVAAAARRLQSDLGVSENEVCRVFWVPGRIEVVGKHTDYAGGRSLLCATNRGFIVVSAARSDSLFRIASLQFESGAADSTAEIPLVGNVEVRQGHWSNYAAAACRRMSQNFGGNTPLYGCDVAVACDLPPASGMSTSSALICSIFLVLDARNNLRAHELFSKHLPTEEALYEYLGCNENGQSYGALQGDKGVGTFGGSEDHTAIMSSDPGTLKMFSYRPTVLEGVFKLSDEVTFVIASSGAVAEKTGDKMNEYNDAAGLAREAAAVFVAADAGAQAKGCADLASCIQFCEDKAVARAKISEACRACPPEEKGAALLRRFEQFFIENEEVVPGVAKAFADNDFSKLGELVDLSQKESDEKLGNIIPETRWLPAEARKLGALASSAFGAGFGGSAWALVKLEDAQHFLDRWKTAYITQFPKHASGCEFFTTLPGPGACELWSDGVLASKRPRLA